MKKPPSVSASIEAEQSILGGLMLDNSAWLDLADIIRTEHFSRPDHQAIFSAIASLCTERKASDPVTVSEALQRRGKLLDVGGLAYLGALTRDTPGASNVRAYAEIVRQRWKDRQAIAIATRLQGDISEGDGAVDRAVQGLMALSHQKTVQDGLLGDSVVEFVDHLDSLYRKEVEPTRIKTGIPRLDAKIGGFSKGHLIVIAGRPSMGKTTLALNIAANNCQHPIGMMSGEQPRRELVRSIIAMKSGVSAHHMRLGSISEADWPQITMASKVVREMPFYVNDQPSPWIEDIERQARKWKHYYNIELLISDYLQRQNGRGDKRHEQVETIVRGHKEIARELDIPVILLSQIGRECERRDDKRPLMGDMKDSGAIEQEADVIITLYRDEIYYGRQSQRAGEIELGTIKNRHGPTGVVGCRFTAASLRIEDHDFNADPDFGSGDLPLGGAPGGDGTDQRPMENRRGPYRRSTSGG